MAWQPDQQKLDQVGVLLTACADPTNHEQHVQALQMLEQGKRDYPDFGCYLLIVFCEMPNASPQLRRLAGIELKNTIKAHHQTVSGDVLTFVKTGILKVLADPVREIRRTAAVVISTVVTIATLDAWPDLMQQLVGMVDSGSPEMLDGAMGAFRFICDDASGQLSDEKQAEVLNAMITKFIVLFSSQNAEHRCSAVYCIRQFIYRLPNAFVVNLPAFLQGLLGLHKDTSAEVRKEICSSLCHLVEVKADFLSDPSICQFVIEFLIWTTEHDSDYDVKREACEFWSSLCESDEVPDGVLKPYLTRLTLVLLNGMVYSDDELAALSDELENKESEINPSMLHAHSKHGVADDEDDEDDEDEDDDGGVDWTLRKCSASGLDTIANHYQADILEALLPHIHNKLQDTDWRVQESAVLAMGALAEGCKEGLSQRGYLPDFIAFLINQLLNAEKPLVRSITCWTLSRYSEWVCEQQPAAMLEPLVMGILKCCVDGNKKVQEAACSAIATIEEAGQRLMAPFIPAVLQCFAQALQTYQQRNLIIMYDACGTLADVVGSELNRPEYLAVLMPPLIGKWESIADDDRSLSPLLECLSSVVIALGQGFAQYAPPVFARCTRLIDMALNKQRAGLEEGTENDLIVCSLDLISGMAEGLGSSIESLVAQTSSLPLFLDCCQHWAPDVRQSAFALMGDLCKSAGPHLQPYLPTIMSLLQQNIDPDYVSVCNNATWAMGLLAMRFGPEIESAVPELITALINLMGRPKLNPALLQNTAITIGRFGLMCPDTVAAALPQFVAPWCTVLAKMKDDTEKEHAFRGMAKMALVNPQGCLDAFEYLCEALASWDMAKMPQDLRDQLGQMLAWFKQNLQQAGAWETIYGRVPQPLQEALMNKYSLSPV
mmetsp:Transcript_67270/g.154555  ORF Transcript_67270/g.154555 Transcript_67270/m.154555 type:complete len:888 (+) Transcript_67270:81-2744(+)